ncbi:hypothetical protein D3C71_2086970 [compost metagenome]
MFQETLHHEEVNIKEVYQGFLDLKQHQSKLIFEHVEKAELGVSETDHNQREKTLLTILTLVHHANTYKRLAEKMIDQLK